MIALFGPYIILEKCTEYIEIPYVIFVQSPQIIGSPQPTVPPKVARISQLHLIEERRVIFIWGRKKGAVGGAVQSIQILIPRKESVYERETELNTRGVSNQSTYRVYILSYTYFPNTRPIFVRQEEDQDVAMPLLRRRKGDTSLQC